MDVMDVFGCFLDGTGTLFLEICSLVNAGPRVGPSSISLYINSITLR